MKYLIKFWDVQKEYSNLQNCLIIIPFAIFSGMKYYQYVLVNSTLITKMIFIFVLVIISLMVILRPYIFFYQTENILTHINNIGDNKFEINVQPTISTTFIGKFKLLKFKCASTSKASYVVVNNKLNDYKQGDKIFLLIGSNDKVEKIL